MKMKSALMKGVSAVTPVAIVKVIVIGIGSLILTAMSESMVEDIMKKHKAE